MLSVAPAPKAFDRNVAVEAFKGTTAPKRLAGVLAAYAQTAAGRGATENDRLAALRRELSETEARLPRATELTESGLEDVDDRLFRERYTGRKVRRMARKSSSLPFRNRRASAQPIITPEKLVGLGAIPGENATAARRPSGSPTPLAPR